MSRSIALALAGALTALTLALAAAPASAEVVWLCKPGLPDDPCTIPQDTTVREFDRPDRVETPPVASDRGVDCFYVYPTVSNQRSANATKARDPELVSIAKYQAARFDQHCRIYAPIYRQATLLALSGGAAAPPDRRLAYEDVREAFKEYLAKHNEGRGVVLLGHSQGTRQLRQLVRQEVDPDPALRRRVVSSILLGANVTVAQGRTAGGDFANVPLCTERAQIGCVVAFSTFAQDPPENPRFGRSTPSPNEPVPLPGGPGFEVACTDPRPLAGTTEPYRTLTPSEPFAPGPINAGIVVTEGGPPPSAPTTWVVRPDRLEGSCRTINEANVLRLEPVGRSRRPNPYPDPTWGTHLIDVNVALDPLVSLVGQQADRYLRPQLRLTRRCTGGGRLRLRLDGRDAGFVRDVDFKLGRRLAARDTAAGFERTLERSALRRTRARKVRAVASLAQGAPQRMVLERSLPRCGVR